MAICNEFVPLKLVIFHSYVSLSEGIFSTVNEKEIFQSEHWWLAISVMYGYHGGIVRIPSSNKLLWKMVRITALSVDEFTL